MAKLNTETETKDLDEAIDFAITCVENICSQQKISLTSDQMQSYAALVISNNFESCATELYFAVITKLFNLDKKIEQTGNQVEQIESQ